MSVQLLRPSDPNFRTNNDVLVVWGQPEATAYGAGQSNPVVQGQRAQGSDNKLDDFVKDIEESKQSVEHTRDVGKSLTEIAN